jgi:hypothetical protein
MVRSSEQQAAGRRVRRGVEAVAVNWLIFRPASVADAVALRAGRPPVS